MDITIIGTGNMARGIATRALAGGHAVTLLGTEAGKAEALAGELSGEVRTGAVGDPLQGDVVVPAVWYHALGDVIGRYGDQLSGKVVVDITNPIDFETFDSLVVPADASAAAEIAAALPESRVLKAFNTTFAGTLAAGTVGSLPTTVLIAGDDTDAKSTLAGIVTSGGLKAIDAGSLKRARELEALGFLQLTLAAAEKISWTGGFGVAA
jgi:8-hydroxy-5-deazaflavin:NADPH oxidoreductase